MKILMYMAVSVDGFIADQNGETPWSDEEWEAFEQFQKSCDALLIGRNTYDEMNQGGDLDEACTYYVATKNSVEKPSPNVHPINISSSKDLPKVEKLGVAGGSILNTYVMDLGVVDQLTLDVEPVAFGRGKPLFGKLARPVRFKLIESKKLGVNTIQNRYLVA